MTTQPPDDDLTAATNRLASKVGLLGERIAVAEETTARLDDTVQRQRRTIKVLAAVAILLLVGGLWLWNVAGEAENAAEAATQNAADNKATAVRGCQNANESRVGARRLWLGIIDAPGPDGKPRTRLPAEQAQVNDLRSFIEDLYQQRDCSDLNRKYPLPELPASLQTN